MGLDFVHRVLTEARRYLKKTGRLFMEAGNAVAVEKTWSSVPFTWVNVFDGRIRGVDAYCCRVKRL